MANSIYRELRREGKLRWIDFYAIRDAVNTADNFRIKPKAGNQIIDKRAETDFKRYFSLGETFRWTADHDAKLRQYKDFHRHLVMKGDPQGVPVLFVDRFHQRIEALERWSATSKLQNPGKRH